MNIDDCSTDKTAKYNADELILMAADLLRNAGLSDDRAESVAEILTEGDLLGHDTHGLGLLAAYLKDLESGKMRREGDPEIISDTGSVLVLDGKYLPGPWLVIQAMEKAFKRAQQYPLISISIRRSHHIACLAAYLKRATDKHLFCVLTSSDPSVRSIAPFGGTVPVYTPNPIAAGIPTNGDPILIDICVSCTSNGLVARHHRQGSKLPHPWLLDPEGKVTDDPSVFFQDPPGSILPLGESVLGYKGFALGILVEALTSGLSGFGRSETPEQWGASVFMQIINPAGFGGYDAFIRETGYLKQMCIQNPSLPDGRGVRLPGEKALAMRKKQIEEGVILHPDIIPDLKPWAEKLNVELPMPR